MEVSGLISLMHKPKWGFAKLFPQGKYKTKISQVIRVYQKHFPPFFLFPYSLSGSRSTVSFLLLHTDQIKSGRFFKRCISGSKLLLGSEISGFSDRFSVYELVLIYVLLKILEENLISVFYKKWDLTLIR